MQKKAWLVCVGMLGVSLNIFAADGEPSIDTRELGIHVFEAVCLKTAPSFANARDQAAAFGLSNWIALGQMKFVMAEDNSLSVQITEGQECAVTTPSVSNESLTQQFSEVISSYPLQGVADAEPFKMRIDGKDFIIKHDRTDGEAYVILKVAGEK